MNALQPEIGRLVATLCQQVAEGAGLDSAIAANLKKLGYGG